MVGGSSFHGQAYISAAISSDRCSAAVQLSINAAVAHLSAEAGEAGCRDPASADIQVHTSIFGKLQIDVAAGIIELYIFFQRRHGYIYATAACSGIQVAGKVFEANAAAAGMGVK